MSTLNDLQSINSHLTSGYIRQQYMQRYSRDFAAELIQFIATLLGCMLMTFDTINKDWKHVIQQDGYLIKSKTMKVLLYGCSIGVRGGVFTFRIKCLSSGNDEGIGIMSDINECSKTSTMNTVHFMAKDIKGYKYYWLGKRGIYAKHDEIELQSFDVPDEWEKDDIISIKVDCNKWKVTFSRNDKQEKSMEIKSNLTYYLFVTTQWHGSSYQLLAD